MSIGSGTFRSGAAVANPLVSARSLGVPITTCLLAAAFLGLNVLDTGFNVDIGLVFSFLRFRIDFTR